MGRRQVLKIPGVTHGKAPIPLAVKIGNMVYSSALMGKDPATNALPEDPAMEIEWLFRHVRTLMEAAGGTTGDIIKMNVLLKDESLREKINEEWVAMFPDENDRPARHITVADLHGGARAQIELVAVLE